MYRNNSFDIVTSVYCVAEISTEVSTLTSWPNPIRHPIQKWLNVTQTQLYYINSSINISAWAM